jgi:hypothetical protein
MPEVIKDIAIAIIGIVIGVFITPPLIRFRDKIYLIPKSKKGKTPKETVKVEVLDSRMTIWNTNNGQSAQHGQTIEVSKDFALKMVKKNLVKILESRP